MQKSLLNMVIDTKKARTKFKSTEQLIFEKFNDLEIYQRYIPGILIGRITNSPFRQDRNPSFGLFYSRTGKIFFKDYGTGESGDIVKFLRMYHNCTNNTELYDIVANDLNLANVSNRKKAIPIQKPDTVQLGIVRQPFTDVDIQYWAKYHIPKSTLEKFNVFSIKHYLCNGVVKDTYKLENPMFAYCVYDKFKIYKPLACKYTKWRNNLTQFDIQGWAQLPEKGDHLVITKALKDVMVLHEMGIPAIATSSESTFLPDIVIEAILKRFKRVSVIFDRDVPGIKNMRKIRLKTGLNVMCLNKKFKAKDISDAVEINGINQVEEWLKEKLGM